VRHVKLCFSVLVFLMAGCGVNAPTHSIPEEQGGSFQSSIIGAGAANLEALLGSAYNSEKEVFIGDRCLQMEKPPAITGKSHSGFTFEESISEEQLSSDLGFGLGARARFGAVSTSLSAKFLSSAMSNSLSVSAVWESSYEFPTQKLDQPTLTPVGTAVKDNFERWATTCGDEYVAELTTGAKLFFSIRVDFTSEQEKKEFEAKFSVSGPLWGVDGELKKASEKMGRHIKINITAFQVGGDTRKLTGLFDQTTEGKANFLQCQLGNLEGCSKVIQAALSYATDVEKGFPSQLDAQTAAVLGYKTVPYSAVAIYPGKFPGLEEAVRLARKEVADAFETQFHYLVIAERLMKQRGLGNRRAPIEGERTKIKSNLTKLLDISKVCYESADKCWATVQEKLHLDTIDATLFLPPSFQTLCALATAPEPEPDLAVTFSKLQSAAGKPDASCAQVEREVRRMTSLKLEHTDQTPIRVDLRMLATFNRLVELTATHLGIDDLTALGSVSNLRTLKLSDNRIVDIEPLSEMVDLLYLDLNNNLVRDVSPLAGLLRAQWMYLTGNRIEDVKKLGFFPAMQILDLRSNPLPAEQVTELQKRIPQATIFN